jgi:hypothetical protein
MGAQRNQGRMWPSPSTFPRAPRRAGASPSEVTISNRGNQPRPYRRLPTRRPGSDSSRRRRHCTLRARRCRLGSQIWLKAPRNHGPVVGSEHPRPHGWAPAHMRCNTTSCPKGTSKAQAQAGARSNGIVSVPAHIWDSRKRPGLTTTMAASKSFSRRSRAVLWPPTLSPLGASCPYCGQRSPRCR